MRTMYLAGFDDDLAAETASAGDPNILAIHALAQSMAPLRAQVTQLLNDVGNADAPMTDDDFNVLAADVEQLATLHAQIAEAIAAANASNPDAATAAELHNWMGFAADWTGQTLAAVPGAIASGAHAIVDATTGAVVDGLKYVTDMLGQILQNTTHSAIQGIMPLLLFAGALGVGLLVFTKEAEKRRTYRKYVA